jgi:photosystem II stability/assembly factor-like uncharacterized protein
MKAMNRIIYILSGLMIFFLPARAQWQLIDTIDGANYMNVHFYNADHGIISGEMEGRFFRTANGGQSWDTVHVPFIDPMTDFLVDMQFVNKDIGFACGGSGFSLIQSILMRTTNGGSTWDSVTSNIPEAIELHGVDFKITGNGLKGVVYSYSALLRSDDSGKTLIQINKPAANYTIEAAVYLGDSTILITGLNYLSNRVEINKTYNWGASWQLVYSDSLNYSSLALNGSNGFATSWKGYIVKTTDAGNTWTKMKIAGDSVNFTKVKYGGDGYPYLLATNLVYAGGYVFGSDNNGQTWHSVLVDSANWLTDISMPTAGTGYVITNRKLYKTSNGGGLGLHVGNIPGIAKDVKLYPNPASGWLSIEAPPSVEIKAMALYDDAGKCIGKWEGQRQRINVAGFAKGIYYMRVEANETVFTKKLILE